MKRNKGFTLIELLAVIVVLAIILVITIPTIMHSMKNTKEKQAQNVVDAVANWIGKQYQLAEINSNSIEDFIKNITVGKTIVMSDNSILKKAGINVNDNDITG